MPLTLTDLKLYGSASMPDNNTPTNIGGVIDTTKKVSFSDFGGSAQGVIQNEGVALTGTTPRLYVASIERLLKGLKGATTGGAIAVESQSAERQNTAQAGSTSNTLVLDVGASAVNGFYNGMVVRLISGLGTSRMRSPTNSWATAKVPPSPADGS